MDFEQVACMIIANAGDARSNCLGAINIAKEGNFIEAKNMLNQANEALIKAHEEHTKVLTKDARGEEIPMSFLLVHAADHLASAEVIFDLADTIITLFERRENV